MIPFLFLIKGVIKVGQYYRFLNLDKKQRCEKNRYGWKLTEHSYVGDEYCTDIISLLSNEWKGDRIIHVGDFAMSNDSTNTAGLIVKLNKEFKQQRSFYKFGKSFDNVEPSNYNKKIRYVYNLDKKEYLDLFHQPIINVSHDFVDVEYLKFSSFALLTACGNGLGGGDYNGFNVEEVGKWAGDHFVTSEKKLDKYNDFKEYKNIFYEYFKYGINLHKPLDIKSYDEYNEEYIKAGVNCLDWMIGKEKYIISFIM